MILLYLCIMLQAGRSRFRFLMRSLDLSTELILPAALWPLGPAEPLTEMSTRNRPWGKGRPARKAENLSAICEPIVWKMRQPRRLTTLWASMACYRDSFTFLRYYRDLIKVLYQLIFIYKNIHEDQ
jgi:hypothetical protein